LPLPDEGELLPPEVGEVLPPEVGEVLPPEVGEVLPDLDELLQPAAAINPTAARTRNLRFLKAIRATPLSVDIQISSVSRAKRRYQL
jgi:hypothetical protein